MVSLELLSWKSTTTLFTFMGASQGWWHSCLKRGFNSKPLSSLSFCSKPIFSLGNSFIFPKISSLKYFGSTSPLSSFVYLISSFSFSFCVISFGSLLYRSSSACIFSKLLEVFPTDGSSCDTLVPLETFDVRRSVLWSCGNFTGSIFRYKENKKWVTIMLVTIMI